MILASASPARLGLLRRAGLDPEVVVSGVDEESFESDRPVELTARLARAKAEAVAALPASTAALVLGCDSLLELDGVAYGKPLDAATAVERWRRLRGRRALLHTGHHLIDTAARDVPVPDIPRSRPSAVGMVESTLITFGEPLGVAGGFTIDGRGGAFVAGIDGNPSNVVGLSIPVLRAMLADLGISLTDLWTPEQPTPEKQP